MFTIDVTANKLKTWQGRHHHFNSCRQCIMDDG